MMIFTLTKIFYSISRNFSFTIWFIIIWAERRLKELLTWLTNFYDFEFLEGHPNRIHITEIYGEY